MTTAVAARYDITAPSVADFRATVDRNGSDPVLWYRLCAAAGVPADAADPTPDQLDALARVVSAQPGVLGVLGRSLGVRLTTSRVLSRLNGAPR